MHSFGELANAHAFSYQLSVADSQFCLVQVKFSPCFQCHMSSRLLHGLSKQISHHQLSKTVLLRFFITHIKSIYRTKLNFLISEVQFFIPAIIVSYLNHSNRHKILMYPARNFYKSLLQFLFFHVIALLKRSTFCLL